MRWPPRYTVPLFGLIAPSRMLVSVVLPAPFGPIRPISSGPSNLEIHTLVRTCRPPKLLCRSCTTSSIIDRPRGGGARGFADRHRLPGDMAAGEVVDERSDKTVAGEPECHHQQNAEEHQPPGGHVDGDTADLETVAQHLQGKLDDDCADCRGGEVLDAADDRHRDHQAHLQQKQVVRGDDADIVGLHGACRRRHHGGDDEDQDLVARRVDAERRRRILIFTQGAHEQSELRAGQPGQDGETAEQEREHHEVRRQLVGLGEGVAEQRDAVFEQEPAFSRPAWPRVILISALIVAFRISAKPRGEQREVSGAQPQHQQPDQQAEYPAHDRAEHDPEPHRHRRNLNGAVPELERLGETVLVEGRGGDPDRVDDDEVLVCR